MPKIKPNESKESYISRCIEFCIKNEGLTKEQAVGKCFGMYENHTRGHSISKHLEK